MNHPDRVQDYLEHIAQALNRATTYLQHLDDFAPFEQDQRSQDAVLRNITIIGEAVSRIYRAAPNFIAEHPELPWAIIRAMRNLVIHEYSYVDLQIIWRTVKDDMPAMKRQIDRLLKKLRKDLQT